MELETATLNPVGPSRSGAADANSLQSTATLVLKPAASKATQLRRRIVIGVGVTVLVAAIVAVLVVVLSDKARPSTLNVPHTFSASFRMSAPATDDSPAAPVSGSLHKTTLADGTWRITGTASVTAHDQTTSVVIADDGGVYFSVQFNGKVIKQGCMEAAAAPALDTLKNALQSAVTVTSASYKGAIPTGCISSQSWVVEFSGLFMVVCMKTDGSLELSGDGVSGVMFNIDSQVSATSPYTPSLNATTGAAMQCAPLYDWADAATSRLRRLDGGDYPYPPLPMGWPKTRRLRQERNLASASTKGPFNTCVFVHGGGQYLVSSITSSFSTYWGSVHNRVKCSTKKFLHLDTLNRAWDDSSNQRSFCSAAMSSDGLIHNTIVFAHGSGNLIVASALAAKRCSFDTDTSAWMELQDDYNIGHHADFAESFCKQNATWTSQQQKLQSDIRLCVPGTDKVALGWSSVAARYVPRGTSWKEVADIITSKVDGAMCGQYAPGLLASPYWNVLADYNRDATGEVQWSRCWGTTYSSLFSSSPAPFYAAAVNYLDVTCRNGDGSYDSNRQPCTWFRTVTNV